MSQPLYFLPRVEWRREQTPAATRELLRQHGLADVFADVPQDQIGFNNLAGRGPNELSGCIIFYNTPPGSAPRRAGYYPKEQAWHAVDDGTLLWIGLDTDARPTPADLRRAKVFAGYEMELGDGHRWEIPIIRRPIDDGTSLPTRQYVEGGQLVQSIKAAYQTYWDESGETADFFFGGRELSKLRLHELCVRALSINYRFGPHEQKLLDVVDGENFLALLAATVDRPNVLAVRAAQKKSEPPTAEASST